jgi:protein O-GlcNAc transferase
MNSDKAQLAAVFSKATSALDRGNLEEAAKGFRRVLSLDQNNAEALRLLANVALRQKRPIEAVKFLQKALQQKQSAEVLVMLGRAQRATKDATAALESFKHALALEPDFVDALHEAARTYADVGQLDAAVDVFQRLLSLRPEDVALYFELAKMLRDRGHIAEAAEVLLIAQERFSDNADLYLQLGSDLAAIGNWEGAQMCFSARCTLVPRDAVSQYNWGVALQELERPLEAVDAFERAIGIKSDYAVAYYGLGLAYRKLGADDAALMAVDMAIAANNTDPRFALERARVLLSLNKSADALATLDALLARHPTMVEALNVKGVALKNLHRSDEALVTYDKALALQPDMEDALKNRGNLRLAKRNFSAALVDFDRAQQLRPGSNELAGLRLYAGMHLYRWTDFDATVRALAHAVAEGSSGIQPLAMACIVDDPEVQQQASRIWAKEIPRPQGNWQRSPGARRPGKIRLVYVSGDFKSHPVSFLMAEIFELHDRDKFELIALNYGAASNDPMQDRLRESFDQFHDVETMADQRIVELARSLDVDVAVDLSGFTAGARTGLFAWRLAPVQVMYIGYLGTSGADFFDYVIADPVIVTPDTRKFYDEKVIYLPWYQANDRRRPRPSKHASREELGLPTTGFVFCCFNNPSKLTPTTFDVWVEILKMVPGSALWLLGEEEEAKENLRSNAKARGLDPARLVFAHRGSRATYLANLASADLFLDTLPYNAGTTASDALWMGLPVLTLRGRSFAGRVAASVLESAGFADLIVSSHAEYRESAVRLALDPEERKALRNRLEAAWSTCRLFDSPSFTAHLEDGLSRALQLHEGGQAPEDLVVEHKTG